MVIYRMISVEFGCRLCVWRRKANTLSPFLSPLDVLRSTLAQDHIAMASYAERKAAAANSTGGSFEMFLGAVSSYSYTPIPISIDLYILLGDERAMQPIRFFIVT